MAKNKVIGYAFAAIGLALTGVLLFGALKFYHSVSEIILDNPALVAPRDTLKAITTNDTLVEINAGLQQKIAQKLIGTKEKERIQKQILLHQVIYDFILGLDSMQSASMSHSLKLIQLKNSVNKTNLSCRAALFDINDASSIDGLTTFLLVDEKATGNSIFECFSQAEIPTQCYEKIKHQALQLETSILEKNFNKLE